MKPEDKKVLEEMKTMGTMSQSQAIEYHRLLTIEETPVVEEVVEVKEPEVKPKKKKIVGSMNKNDPDSTDFLSDKKESIGLVIYQISQLDKSMTQLTERLDVIVNRLEIRIQAIELWKATFNQKIATQDQIDSLREDYRGLRNFGVFIISTVAVVLIGALLRGILKV